MDRIAYSLFGEIKTKTIFSVNDFQVIFNTDLKTANNLESDDVLREYIRAVLQENLLQSSGIKSTDEITSIQRLEDIDVNKSFIVLDIATSLNHGIEELHCLITEERIVNDDRVSSEDSSSWSQQVPDSHSGPLLRWNSVMTNLLIQIRGDMDPDFDKAKYKFRLWERVAARLNSRLTCVKVTAKDCDDKWRNIVATYRKNVDKLKYFGDNSVRWEYFNAMDDVLKGTKNLQTDIESGFMKLAPEMNGSEGEIRNEPYEIINVDYPSMEEVEINNDEESFENSLISKKSSGEERMWSTEQCLTLLCLRKQADCKYIGSYESQQRCWEELATHMSEKFLTDFGADEVAFVWNQCNLLYEINLDHLKSRGVDSVKWKYFAVMDEIRGGTNDISEICIPRPGEHLLSEFHRIQLENSYRLADELLCDTNILNSTTGLTANVTENSDSEDNGFTISAEIMWTQDLTRTLISVKKSVEQDIQQNKIPRKKLWWSVARKLRLQRHLRVTEETCEEKWRDLVKVYRKNLAKVQRHGISSVDWPFFGKMHDLFSTHSSDVSDSETKRKIKLDGVEKFDTKSVLKPLRYCFSNENSNDIPENTSNDLVNLATAIRELQDNQNKLLREIVDNQQRRIDQLHQEQLTIKSLLTQLLKKLS